MKYLWGPILLLFLLAGAAAQDPQLTKKQSGPKPKSPAAKTATVKSSPAAAAKKGPAVKQKSAITVKPAEKPASPATKPQASSLKKEQAARKKKLVTAKPGAPKPPTEAEEYQKAISLDNPAEKVAALKAFLEKFPASKKKAEALELIAITRIKLAQDKLTAAETESGIALLKTAIDELPVPVPEKLFSDSISKIPPDLFNNGQRTAAVEIASMLEPKISDNSGQLLSLAGFFLMTENGSEAKNLAEKAIAVAPTSSAYQMLGLAERLNFKLDEASQAYSKALELEPDSQSIVRSLADLKRAQGKPDEAADLYRKILEKDSASLPAQTGLILALFDAGKRADAETEMAKSLEQNPNNVILLAGAAYWYAGHNDADKAIEFSQMAIAADPRYIWSHIALAHGYLEKKQPADAEQVLLKARIYGNFPTLEYEIASARLMSGFYRDAVEELHKSFSIKDGIISTKLGGRVDSEQSSFIDALANERRASTFEPDSADDKETAARLKSLLEFDQIINAAEPNEDAAAAAADAFVNGDDNAKLHRQLYAASSLLSKRIALLKVTELAQAAVGKADAALDIPDPGAAVMASELYDSRMLALTRNELIKVPPVPKATLSAILRGRIEEIAGWALFYQNKPAEAVIRLRRAVSVMPDKSAWWRSSMWRLGAALQADGKDAEALDSYIKSYSIDKPDGARYAVVESLYKKVHGNTEGLEAKIGTNPMPLVAQVSEVDPAAKSANADAAKASVPQSSDAPSTVKGDSAAKPIATSVPEATATPVPEPSPEKVVNPTPSPEASATPTPEASPDKVLNPSPTPAPQIEPSPTQEANPTPTPQPSPPVIIQSSPSLTPEATPKPTAETTPTPASLPTSSEPAPTPTPTSEAMPSPTPAATSVETKPGDKTGSPEQGAAASQTLSSDQPKKEPDSKPSDSSVALNAGKPLFEPVIITVPKQSISKNAEIPPEKKADESKAPPEPGKAIEPTAESRDTIPADKGDLVGIVRPRIVQEKAADDGDGATCSITLSQDAISILNNGGSLGVLVRMDGDGNPKSINATSSSPDDIEVKLEPEIAGLIGQAFYVIRSLSAKTGEFKVIFIAPCGRKEMAVNVR